MKKLVTFFLSEIGRIILGLVFFLPAFILDKIGIYVVSLVLFLLSLAVAGMPVFIDAVKGIIRRDLFDEKFLMSIASIGAIIVGEASEGVTVMLFFLIGEYFEHKAVQKSRCSIKSLMDIRPDEACVFTEYGEEVLDAEDVPLGSVIVMRAGERVPIDSVIISGRADVDTSALTGESMPRSVGIHDKIDSGTVVINGVLRARTVRLAEESRAARILSLVENANERKSKAENFITAFSRIYTPIVVISAVLLAVVPSLFSLTEWRDSIYRALIFLVISCPCALVISVPMAFFGGIGRAASEGILFKGGNTFSKLAKADTYAFDKTGTLTTGKFTVFSVICHGASEDEILKLAASAEYGSNHPIAKCIKDAVKSVTPPDEFFEIPGKGVSALIGGSRISVGNSLMLKEKSIEVPNDEYAAATVYVVKDSRLIGEIKILDEIKSEAKVAIKLLKASGVKKTVMLTGDKFENAERVCSFLPIDEIAYELMPEEKYSHLEALIESSLGTVYVGDGINDAPSISRADVGIAMGNMGADSAIESADVVIMSDNLMKLPEAVRIARKTVSIASQNIVFALGVKGLILILGALGIANMWLAVFADVGVAILAILNSLRTLRRGK